MYTSRTQGGVMCKDFEENTEINDEEKAVRLKLADAGNKLCDVALVAIKENYQNIKKEFDLGESDEEKCTILGIIMAKMSVVLTMSAPLTDKGKTQLIDSSYAFAKQMLEGVEDNLF